MERKTLGTIAVGIILLMAIVIIVGAGPSRAVAQAREMFGVEQLSLDRTSKQLSEAEQTIHDLTARHPSQVRPIAESEAWADAIAETRTKLDELRRRFDTEALPLAEPDSDEDAVRLTALLEALRDARAVALDRVQRIRQRAERIADFLDRRPAFVTQARDDASALAAISLVAVESKARQAEGDWPEKKDDIEARLAALREEPAHAANLAKLIESDLAKDAGALDIEGLVSRIDELHALRGSLPQSIETLSKLLDQLDVSYDRLLADMEIREGAVVEFYHQYRIVRVDRDNKADTTTEWKKVSESVYKQHESHLGMALESKPKGKYDFEATKLASPPGYQYVGNPHYGEWRTEGSRSFWVFYGRYALMRDLFWGRRYGPVYRTDWDSYRRNVQTRRTYYGPTEGGKPRFGSSGTFTRTRYASTKYVSSGGFAQSRYKKSGGTYRGSRYSSSGSRSSSYSGSSTRRGFRSFGGSRSFGK